MEKRHYKEEVTKLHPICKVKMERAVFTVTPQFLPLYGEEGINFYLSQRTSRVANSLDLIYHKELM
jgi:hypothetical protein